MLAFGDVNMSGKYIILQCCFGRAALYRMGHGTTMIQLQYADLGADAPLYHISSRASNQTASHQRVAKALFSPVELTLDVDT